MIFLVIIDLSKWQFNNLTNKNIIKKNSWYFITGTREWETLFFRQCA